MMPQQQQLVNGFKIALTTKQIRIWCMKESGKLNKESLPLCTNNHRRHGKGKRKHYLLKKKNAMAKFENKKAIAKFAAFLITGSALNVFGVAVPSVIAYTISATMNSDVVYLSYTIIFLSYIQTPILIIVFLKPVRKRLCHLFCSKYHKDNETIPMQYNKPSQYNICQCLHGMT